MAERIVVGCQSFEELRARNGFYVDKTAFIEDWWERGNPVTVIARPRRFGKTLMLHTVEDFFSVRRTDQAVLFGRLAVWQSPVMKAEAGQYPVIRLSWGNAEGTTYEAVRALLVGEILRTYWNFDYLLESDRLPRGMKAVLSHFSLSASDAEVQTALLNLCIALHRHHGVKPIVLLDEYDTPMQEAWLNGFWDKTAAFVKVILTSTFKNNPSLERGLITGITRVGKESIFSDLNNPDVVTTTTEKYETAFGFTEEEVWQAMAARADTDRAGVKAWYDGFTFGRVRDIYNPWSVSCYLDKKRLAPYWANTSSNALVSRLLQRGNRALKERFEMLLAGGTVTAAIEEEIAFQDMDAGETSVLSLLLASGYLRVEKENSAEDTYDLSLTNQEVRRTFEKLVRAWFERAGDGTYADFLAALLEQDAEGMTQTLGRLLTETVSYFDAAGAPEKFYHGFVLGLLVTFKGRFVLTSNRESGRGRYDVMLKPVDPVKDDAYILEFKVADGGGEALSAAADAALVQIEKRRYGAALEAEGIARNRIHAVGLAFAGKDVLVRVKA